MSYDRKQKREHIKQYVAALMDGHEPDTFAQNQNGEVFYTAGRSTINLVVFFEHLLSDYLDDYLSHVKGLSDRKKLD